MQCPTCGESILPPSVAGVERGGCVCWRDSPGRLYGQLFYATADQPTRNEYGITWNGELIKVEPPTLERAFEVLQQRRAEWRAQQLNEESK